MDREELANKITFLTQRKGDKGGVYASNSHTLPLSELTTEQEDYLLEEARRRFGGKTR